MHSITYIHNNRERERKKLRQLYRAHHTKVSSFLDIGSRSVLSASDCQIAKHS